MLKVANTSSYYPPNTKEIGNFNSRINNRVYVASSNELAINFAEKAIEQLLESANLKADSIDLIVSTSLTIDHVACSPEVIGPRLAYPIHKSLNAINAMVLDLTASSWGACIDAARTLASQMQFKNVIIVRSECTANSISSCEISNFRISDGAAALLLSESKQHAISNAQYHVLDNIPKLKIRVKNKTSAHEPFRTEFNYPIDINGIEYITKKQNEALKLFFETHNIPSTTEVFFDNWFGNNDDVINGTFNIPEKLNQVLDSNDCKEIVIGEIDLSTLEMSFRSLTVGKNI
ncbi:hypothetical protein [Aliikangiella sp. IMCC44359]|uniref:hypothetical protein n=1 Tax=Aliikangiella sp. IMCC44359 TaxID=3459125 RepID=UPI00403AC51C